MKIIDEGNVDWKPWWAGYRLKCKTCGREVELEIGDDDFVWFRPLPNTGYDGLSVGINCERCGTEGKCFNCALPAPNGKENNAD